MTLKITTPYVAEGYPNRVDLLGKRTTYDVEAGALEADYVIDRSIPCAVQEATPALLETLGLRGQEEAQVVVYVHSTRLPPGVVPNRVLRQTDLDPPRDYLVIGLRDLCGMHTDYAVVCSFVD